MKWYGLPHTESPIQEVNFNAIFKLSPAKLVCTLKPSSPVNHQRLFWHQMVVTRYLLFPPVYHIPSHHHIPGEMVKALFG